MSSCRHGVKLIDGVSFCVRCRYREPEPIDNEEHSLVDSFEAMSRPIGLRLMERQGD